MHSSEGGGGGGAPMLTKKTYVYLCFSKHFLDVFLGSVASFKQIHKHNI